MLTMNLEEAMASVDFPVYGLPKTVQDFLGFICRPIMWDSRLIMIRYETNPYGQKLQKDDDPRQSQMLRVCLTIRKGSEAQYNERVHLPPPNSCRTMVAVGGIKGFASSPFKDGKPLTIGRGEINIDGTHFLGDLHYSPAPFFSTHLDCRSAQTYLVAEIDGPDLEEAIQILESLRVLNGKQVD